MQLKKQGKSYSVIRTVYDSTVGVKRGVPRSLGTIAVGNTVIPEKIATQLTPAELADVQEKLNSYAAESANADAKNSIETARMFADRAAENLNNGVRFDTEKEAHMLYESIARLKVALRKAGYKRPRQSPEPSPMAAAQALVAKTVATVVGANKAKKADKSR